MAAYNALLYTQIFGALTNVVATIPMTVAACGRGRMAVMTCMSWMIWWWVLVMMSGGCLVPGDYYWDDVVWTMDGWWWLGGMMVKGTTTHTNAGVMTINIASINDKLNDMQPAMANNGISALAA